MGRIIIEITILQEAHALFKAASDTLDLVLHNKRCEEQKRKKNKVKRKESSEMTATASPIKTLGNKTDLSKLSINLQQAKFPLPSSPEYIWLRKSREKKRSGSLSSLPETRSLSQSISSDEESISSATDSASRVERQNAWLRSVKQGRSSEWGSNEWLNFCCCENEEFESLIECNDD